MFLGVNTLNLDAKGRIAIPAKHREPLVQCCASRVVVTLNPFVTDKCLWLYPENEWQIVARQLAGLPAIDARSQAMKRLMLGHALAHAPRVLFRIGETNIRSRKAIEVVGGTLVEGMVEEGEYQSQPARHVVYEITREGFEAGPLG